MTATRSCLKRYLESDSFRGGLVGISELSNFCGVKQSNLYKDLVELQRIGEIQIVERYWCPESHSVSRPDINDNSVFCEECNLKYSSNDLIIEFYIYPLPKFITHKH